MERQCRSGQRLGRTRPLARNIIIITRSILPATAAEEQLEPGMVLAVTGYVWQSGVGAVFGREAVLITPDGPEVLTSSPSANVAVGA